MLHKQTAMKDKFTNQDTDVRLKSSLTNTETNKLLAVNRRKFGENVVRSKR